jgi:hypothetical protein
MVLGSRPPFQRRPVRHSAKPPVAAPPTIVNATAADREEEARPIATKSVVTPARPMKQHCTGCSSSTSASERATSHLATQSAATMHQSTVPPKIRPCSIAFGSGQSSPAVRHRMPSANVPSGIPKNDAGTMGKWRMLTASASDLGPGNADICSYNGTLHTSGRSRGSARSPAMRNLNVPAPSASRHLCRRVAVRLCTGRADRGRTSKRPRA